MRYDEVVMEKFAKQLYGQATRIVALFGVAGLVFGGFGGLMAGAAFTLHLAVEPGVLALVGAVAGLMLGVAVGNARAFELRFRAQTVLCQVQIERNTRSHTSV
jgi:hypothetical protein